MNSNENFEIASYSIEELEADISTFADKYRGLEDQKGGFTKEEANALVQEFVDQLLNEKEKFSKIFLTEKGSYYFVIEDGKSLRIKYSLNGIDKIRPIKERVFFISNSTAENLLSGRLSHSVGKVINKENYEIGVTPLELNRIKGDINRTTFEETENSILITGTEDEAGAFTPYASFGAWHIGHPITEIIK